jgi:hypothetical protein
MRKLGFNATGTVETPGNRRERRLRHVARVGGRLLPLG